LSLQFVTYILFLIYYYQKLPNLVFHYELLLLVPLVVFILAMIAMGTGIIISSLTSKYRDVSMIVGIGMTLLMYATPIMYPYAAIPNLYKPYLYLNPISPLIEIFRYVFTGTGTFTLFQLIYSFLFGFSVLILGVFIFNRTEKTFMDTV